MSGSLPPLATLEALLSPLGLAALLAWSFIVLAAIQLTIRLIMAFSIRTTAVGALVLAALTLPVALAFDLAAGVDAGLGRYVDLVLVPVLLMALVGFAVARWALRFKRTRGQVVAAAMTGVLCGPALLVPHLFARL